MEHIPVQEFIDFTPKGLQTAEGTDRVTQILEELDGYDRSILNQAIIFYAALKTVCDMAEFKEVMSDDGAQLAELIDWRNECQNRLMSALSG